jgi:hypothetical protein
MNGGAGIPASSHFGLSNWSPIEGDGKPFGIDTLTEETTGELRPENSRTPLLR